MWRFPGNRAKLLAEIASVGKAYAPSNVRDRLVGINQKEPLCLLNSEAGTPGAEVEALGGAVPINIFGVDVQPGRYFADGGVGVAVQFVLFEGFQRRCDQFLLVGGK